MAESVPSLAARRVRVGQKAVGALHGEHDGGEHAARRRGRWGRGRGGQQETMSADRRRTRQDRRRLNINGSQEIALFTPRPNCIQRKCDYRLGNNSTRSKKSR